MARALVAVSPDASKRRFDFAHIARSIAMREAYSTESLADLAQQQGASSDIVRQLKAAVGIGTTSSLSAIAAETGITFIGDLEAQSAFAWMLGNGMPRVPVQQHVVAVSNAAAISTVGEGQVKPITDIGVAGMTIRPSKAMGIVVLSKELMLYNAAALDGELRKSVAVGMDAELIRIASVGAPTQASVGTTDSAARADFRWLLSQVNLGPSSLVATMAPDVANGANFVDDGRGDMTPSGGRYFGVQAIVTPAQPAGTMSLHNAAAFAGDIVDVRVESFSQASVQMETTPDSPVTASTVTLSLWANNLVGLRAEAWFGVVKSKTTASATITAINYSASGMDSPA